MEDVVVGKRRGGMKADQRHYPISEYFVNFLDVMRGGRSADQGEAISNRPKAGSAWPGNRHGDQKDIN